MPIALRFARQPAFLRPATDRICRMSVSTWLSDQQTISLMSTFNIRADPIRTLEKSAPM
jgi:hypothetical protein